MVIIIFVLLGFLSFLPGLQALMTLKMLKKSQSKSFSEIPSIDIKTSCNFVTLQKQHKYSGVVRSGYLSVQKGNSALAFLFYGKSDILDFKLLSSYPTIIWLNGGPGSSSQFGNFQQLGPLKLQTFLVTNVTKNPYSWANQYNLLFVDQPIGTGLSYADPAYQSAFVKSMDEVAEDFWKALTELYQNPQGCFSQKNINISPNSPLYIAGESYAGKYIPAIAKKIMDMKSNGGFLTGLKGISMGDAFTAPYKILSEVGRYSSQLSLLDYQQRAKVQKILLNATHHQIEKNWNHLHECFDLALDYIVEQAGNINVYDITKDGDYEELLQGYLTLESTKSLYGLNDQIIYDSQSQEVFLKLYTDFMKDQTERVQYLLNHSLPVLIYNGQDDLIVQNAGTMKWVQELNYPNATEFRQMLMTPWKINKQVSGSYKKSGNLEFRIVYKAGHMVPMDRPRQSLSMIKDFIERTVNSTDI